jgi:hypothetical protein
VDRKTKRAFDGLVDYLYWRAQQVETEWEHQDASLALQIVANCRQGLDDPVETAYYRTFGVGQERLLQHRRAKEWLIARALNAWKDHTREQAAEEAAGHEAAVRPSERVDREAARGGTVYQMPQQKEPAVQEPLPVVSRKAAGENA